LQLTIISALIFASSILSLSAYKVDFEKNKSPESKTITGFPFNVSSSIMLAFRARPPKGFLGQPQGSVSPQTLEE